MKTSNMNELYKKVVESSETRDHIIQEVKTVIQHTRTMELSDEEYEMLLSTTLVLLAHELAVESSTKIVTKLLEQYEKDLLPVTSDSPTE